MPQYIEKSNRFQNYKITLTCTILETCPKIHMEPKPPAIMALHYFINLIVKGSF